MSEATPELVKPTLVQRFEQWLFPTMAPARLALLRIVLPIAWFALMFRPLSAHVTLLEHNERFHRPQVLMRLVEGIFGYDAAITLPWVTVAWWVALCAGVTTVSGLFSRVSVGVFAFANMLLVTHAYSYGEKHHPEALFLLFLLLMALTPCGRMASADAWLAKKLGKQDAIGWGREAKTDEGMWAIRAIQLCLCGAYLFAGVAKVAVGKAAWFNGYTLQSYLLQDAVRWERELGLWMATQHELCRVIAVGAVGLELLFPIVLFSRRARWLIFPAGVSMHLGIFILQAAPFFSFMLLYLMWFPAERFVRGGQSRSLRVAG